MAGLSGVRLRDFRDADAVHVNRVALAAFDQFRSQYSDWPAMSSTIGRMAMLAENGEIIVAELEDEIIGVVAYIPPGRPKAPYFAGAWPIIRMLVVDPGHRGLGVGRALTEDCLKRARRDGSPVIALHTSPIMTVALSMYIRMGFELLREAPAICGVPYAVYVKRLRP
jgi:ribosomal protein S18 acetylase RimI-like enzyme